MWRSGAVRLAALFLFCRARSGTLRFIKEGNEFRFVRNLEPADAGEIDVHLNALVSVDPDRVVNLDPFDQRQIKRRAAASICMSTVFKCEHCKKGRIGTIKDITFVPVPSLQKQIGFDLLGVNQHWGVMAIRP